jgi:SnoaL-like domain
MSEQLHMERTMIEQLGDRQAITDLIYRYCRSMDRIDRQLGYSIWHDDGLADYGQTYIGSGRGFVDVACNMHAAMSAHSHQITNIIIDLVGDKAGSESYVTAVLRYLDGGQLVQATIRARYIDQWSHRNGRWGIDKRIYVRDFDDVQKVGEAKFTAGGKRNREDVSYSVLPPMPGGC